MKRLPVPLNRWDLKMMCVAYNQTVRIHSQVQHQRPTIPVLAGLHLVPRIPILAAVAPNTVTRADHLVFWFPTTIIRDWYPSQRQNLWKCCRIKVYTYQDGEKHVLNFPWRKILIWKLIFFFMFSTPNTE